MKEVTKTIDKAFEDGQQPKCPHCREPLEISQMTGRRFESRWSDKGQRFVRESDFDFDEPICTSCGEEISAYIIT
jgi:hypothetical protein